MLEQTTQPEVLIVDDSPDARLMLRQALTPAGYLVHEAAGGTAALALAQSLPQLGLVILDLGLPDADGFDVLDTMHRMRGDLPICVASARRDRDSVVKAVHLGCSDYLVKPLYPDAVLAKVDAIVRPKAPHADYQPLKTLLRARILGHGVLPDLHIVELREDGFNLRSTAAVSVGEIIQFACPALSAAVAMPAHFFGRVRECRRLNYGRYILDVTYLGLADDTLTKIRARCIAGAPITDRGSRAKI